MGAPSGPPVPRYSTYDAWAWCYDRHWSRAIPNQLFTVIEQLLLPCLPASARLLDLCCGTGRTAAALAARGFRVTGVDGSAEMLRYARRNAPGVEFIVADARSLALPAVHDGIVSIFDSLNHVLALDELTQVFRGAHAALARGGLFLFDLNMAAAFRRRWGGYSAIVESDHLCVVRSRFDPARRLGRFDVTTFRLHGPSWRRRDVVIFERCYAPREVTAALRTAGFGQIAIHPAGRRVGLPDHAGRVFFLARKSGRGRGRR